MEGGGVGGVADGDNTRHAVHHSGNRASYGVVLDVLADQGGTLKTVGSPPPDGYSGSY